jgi:hypothetical protein
VGEPVLTFRLDAACPTCGSRPAFRVTGEQVQVHARLASSVVVQVYQCHRRTRGAPCRTRYPITAAAYHRAAPEPSRW